MAGETYITVGKLGKPHGVRGAFRFSLLQPVKNHNRIPKHFWLEIAGNKLPWFIEKIEWNSDSDGLINFEEVATPEKARNYTGAELFLTEADAAKYLKKKESGYDFLVGYLALMENEEPIGVIEEVSEATGQVLLRVNREGKDVMIPLVDDFVVELNKRRKQVIFDLPEGLLEL